MPETSLKGMVLAAGFGTRLLPITRVIPKALLPVGGRALLEWNLRYLAESGVRDVVVNAHYLALMVVRWVEERRGDLDLPSVRVAVEPQILGTAGGIANAAARLDTDPVVIMNADQIFRPDLERAVAFHREGRFLATLLCVADPAHRQIRRDGDRVGEILPAPSHNDATLSSFTGVYLLSQEAIAGLPRGGYAEITPHFRAWARDGRLGCMVVEDAPFRDAGDAEGYLEAVLEMDARGAVSPDAIVAADARIEESVVFAGAVIESGAHVARSIVGPGDPVRGACDRRIVAAGESRRIALLPRDEEGMVRALFTPAPRAVRLLAGDGSSRRFARVFLTASTRVVLHAPQGDRQPAAIYPRRADEAAPDENDSYVYVAEVLRRIGVRTPRIETFDRARGLLVLEDLGDTTLFARLRLSDLADADRARLLTGAIEVLLRMQAVPPGEPFDTNRVGAVPYDVDFVLAYEAGYFHREMVCDLAQLEIPFEDLSAEAARVAHEALDGAPRVLMHRDFQSRNLMVTPDGELALIDLQGARLGPPEYDLASLLLDPYTNLSGVLREALLDRYVAAHAPAERDGIHRRFRACGINRMMQALGAYAYLGGRLQKPGFLEYAPIALARLKELCGPDFPAIESVAKEVGRSLGGSS